MWRFYKAHYMTRIIFLTLAIVLGTVFFAAHENAFAKTEYELCIEGGGGSACASRAGAPSVHCPLGLVCLDNPLNTTDIPTLIGLVLRGLFAVIGTIALVIFIYGGALWMTAFGEESKVKRGWDTMIWGALGLVVIFGSYVAVDFILKAILVLPGS